MIQYRIQIDQHGSVATVEIITKRENEKPMETVVESHLCRTLANFLKPYRAKVLTMAEKAEDIKGN